MPTADNLRQRYGKARSTKRGKAAMREASITTTTSSIGNQVAVRIAEACNSYIVAWPGIERDEKDTAE